VQGCERVAEAEPFATVAVGEMPHRLLQDAGRRLAALATLPHPVHPDRERPVPVQGAATGPLGALQRELLTLADGRSTARDLAFRTGRGVYTVTVEIARMLDAGLLQHSEVPTPIPVRVPPDGQGVRQREPAPPAAQPDVPGTLPRRKPGGFFRLRNGAPR
jgi:hypothetical protein